MLQKIKNWWKQENKTNKILTIFSVFLIVFSVFLGTAMNISMAASVPEKLTTSRKDFESGATVSLFNGIIMSGFFVAS